MELMLKSGSKAHRQRTKCTSYGDKKTALPEKYVGRGGKGGLLE